MHLTSRFDHALAYATAAHAGQTRKGTAIPYVSHLLMVTGLVIEHGGSEDEAIAALLHDAVEDAGGVPRLADIRAQFGEAVAAIVDGCSDTDETPKPEWIVRKRAYVAHLPGASASTRLVSAADKLANVRSIIQDHLAIGDDVRNRFNAGKSDVLWYYRALADAFSELGPASVARELDANVRELERLAGQPARA